MGYFADGRGASRSLLLPFAASTAAVAAAAAAVWSGLWSARVAFLVGVDAGRR